MFMNVFKLKQYAGSHIRLKMKSITIVFFALLCAVAHCQPINLASFNIDFGNAKFKRAESMDALTKVCFILTVAYYVDSYQF